MRSRIAPRINVKPTLIGYCIGDEKKTCLEDIAAENGLAVKFIGTESAGETVGYIAGINGFGKSESQPENTPERETLIIAGLKSAAMDRLLRSLREKNVNIDLRCAVTHINQSWELYRLIGELEREHKVMHGLENGGN